VIDQASDGFPVEPDGPASREFLARMRRLRPGEPTSASFDGMNLPPLSIPGLEGLEPVASGGTGIVYRGSDTASGAAVAVKVLLKGTSWSIPSRARARREAELLARIDHPCVVRVLAAGELRGAPGWPDGLPYLVMEWIEGETLQRLVSRRMAPSRESATIARDLARALQAVHAGGVVHRDVKPANVIFTNARGAPVPKLIDFGLARIDHERGGSSGSTPAVGTPGYMAPEQTRVDGALGPVGPAADIFGLGATLFFLLHGRPPYKSTTAAETLARAVAGAIDWSEPAAGPIPRPLRVIVEKCLERQPWRRYRSAADLGDDLDRFLEGRPLSAKRASLARRILARARLRPAIATAVVLGALGAVVAAGGLWWHLSSLRQARDAAIASRDLSRLALARLTDATVERMMVRNRALDDADREYLRGILALYEGWPLDPDPVPARRERVEGLRRLATIFTRVGRVDDAAECYSKALADCTALGRESADGIETHELRLAVLREQGRMLTDAGRPGDAEPPLREALEIARTLPEGPARSIDSLVGSISLQLATVVDGLGRRADAIPLAEGALGSLVRARSGRPDDYAAARDELVALHSVASMVSEESGVDVRRERLRALIARADDCLARFPDQAGEIDVMRVVATTKLIDVENAAGNREGALGLAQDLLANLHAELAALPDGAANDGRRSFLRGQTVFVATKAARALTAVGKAGEPAPLVVESIAIGRADLAAEPARIDHVLRLAEALQVWRDLCRAAGRGDEALEAGREILRVLEPWVGRPEYRGVVDAMAAEARGAIEAMAPAAPAAGE